MADENLELTPGSPNGGDDGGELPPNGGNAEPTQEEIDALPDWAREKVGRLNNVETIISDLKKTAGVNSVKELKGKIAPKPPVAAKPQEAKPAEQVSVTHEEVALLVKGYTPDELAVAKRLRPDLSVSEAVNDDVAKHAIDGMRQHRRTSEVIPQPSDRMPTGGGKPFSERPKEEQKRTYATDFQKNIEKARQNGNRSPGR